MKVVLFCGGYGMRMRSSATDYLPKPMQMVGPRPLLWHIMRYYAHYGHKEFILCLGHGGWHIKDYFLNYHEAASNDFVMRGGDIELLRSDISDWSITFVDTGLESPVGERLRRVRDHIGSDEYFMANYSDGLTDASLDDMVESFFASGAQASMMLVRPSQSFHCVDASEAGEVKEILPMADLSVWLNGGYFVFSRDILDSIPRGGDIVSDALMPLAGEGRLFGYRYEGFWKSADTLKERAELDAAYHRGDRPWMPWCSAVHR